MLPGDETCVVEIPVLSTRWKMGRGFIDGGMAANIRIPRVLARTITVYTNVSAFQKVLGIPGSDDVQACVVTPEGEVLARAPGEPRWLTGAALYKVSAVSARTIQIVLPGIGRGADALTPVVTSSVNEGFSGEEALPSPQTNNTPPASAAD